jgi:hypothetical protein
MQQPDHPGARLRPGRHCHRGPSGGRESLAAHEGGGALELGGSLWPAMPAVFNVIDDLRPGKPQRRLLAEPRAPTGWVSTAEEVAGPAARRHAGRDCRHAAHRRAWDIEILVRQAEEDRTDLWTTWPTRPSSLPDGRRLPLEVVVRSSGGRPATGPCITRVDGRRTVTVEANVDARRASAQAVVDDLVGSQLAGRVPRCVIPAWRLTFEGQVARSAADRRFDRPRPADRAGRHLRDPLLPVPQLRGAADRDAVDPAGLHRGPLGPRDSWATTSRCLR